MTSKKFRFEYAILERPLVLVLTLILCSDVGFLNHSSTRAQDSLAPIQIEYSEIDGTPYHEDAVLEDADDYQKAQCRL